MGVGNDADDSNTDDVRRASLGRIIIIIVAAVDATNNISEPVVAVGVAEFSEMTQKWWSGVAMMLDSHLQKIVAWVSSAHHNANMSSAAAANSHKCHVCGAAASTRCSKCKLGEKTR